MPKLSDARTKNCTAGRRHEKDGAAEMECADALLDQFQSEYAEVHEKLKIAARRQRTFMTREFWLTLLIL